MKKSLLLAILSVLAAVLGPAGCETTQRNDTSTSRGNVSSIPWNRPAKWEGTGMLGGQMGGMQRGGGF